MKYTLNVYGWEGEFVCKSITHEETKSIDDLKEKIEADDYWETKPLNNGTAHFELHDENQEIVLRFTIDDINPTEYDNEYDVRTSPDTNVYCSIDESKGGINSYEIESDSKIYPFDFTFTEGIILLPNGEFWSVIDQIYFKGEEIEPYDHLDNYGKSSTLHIFKHQE